MESPTEEEQEIIPHIYTSLKSDDLYDVLHMPFPESSGSPFAAFAGVLVHVRIFQLAQVWLHTSGFTQAGGIELLATGQRSNFWAVLEHAHGDRFGDFHRDTRRRAASNKLSSFFWQWQPKGADEELVWGPTRLHTI